MASCMEVAYEHLRYADAARMLGFNLDAAENPNAKEAELSFKEFLSTRQWCVCSASFSIIIILHIEPHKSWLNTEIDIQQCGQVLLKLKIDYRCHIHCTCTSIMYNSQREKMYLYISYAV